MASDRDILIYCIKRQYNLLVYVAYLDPDTIESSPPEGWSDEQLVVDGVRSLGRTERVIDLLRHIPYFRRESYGERLEFLVEAVPINYLRYSWRSKGIAADPCVGKSIDHNDVLLMPEDATCPSSFISLTEGREATWWIDEGMRPNRAGPYSKAN
ncbi:hypothetical protein HBI56_193060 [Parastagonospora nodorum]|uniref:Uncharacterized protein n=1 Tax=Phaeosphaeria nodorum (strain SN15 / ATCC MYA-4574 / FGSC 10173) TaxID=321614 RepID=A0A7U2IA49_PHANO|nr:hypothetical protein HBH56_177280 [Parastagonospora nodorum]QRD06064.1 hypothetical protein JI435_146270 [Parastagonospora nodorum SN15]KAH3932030.1 hypothetical protein HBH54_092540 [Parastagonospora nodorum]KAH3939580.1 hypothetical protein HBH53_231890 [Parastagonospora nodorum]KAH3957541.1 hypothetical protein HBH51_223860 [Parastagonospora nodorum]